MTSARHLLAALWRHAEEFRTDEVYILHFVSDIKHKEIAKKWIARNKEVSNRAYVKNRASGSRWITEPTEPYTPTIHQPPAKEKMDITIKPAHNP